MVLADGRVVTASAIGAPRPVLGAARRRRQLRRGHLVHVPRCIRWHTVICGPMVVADRATADMLRLVSRLHSGRSRRGSLRVLRLHDGAAGGTLPRRAPPAKGVRGGLVLHRRPCRGRRGVRARPRHRSRHSTASGEARYPALQSAFDGLYPKGLQWYWRGDFLRRAADDAIDAHVALRRGTADHALDDAPLPDRRCRHTDVGHDATRRGPTATCSFAQVIVGRRPGSGQRGGIDASGRRTTGMPLTRTQRAAPTSTS